MTFTSLMLMMALGLSAAYGLDFGEDSTSDLSDHQAEDFMEDLLDDDDFEIVDMDDALTKYRMLKEIAHVMTRGEFKDMAKHKRFIDFYQVKASRAAAAFDKIVKEHHAEGLDFSDAFNKANTFVSSSSGMSQNACKAAISDNADAILGTHASLAESVSGPLCDILLFGLN